MRQAVRLEHVSRLLTAVCYG